MNESVKIVIADDEILGRRLIHEYLQSHPGLQVIGNAETGTEAVDMITTLRPDIVFLDIQMPELNGLEVLEITQKKSGVIFTTAYDQYALKAFDLYAVDYLLKPFSQDRFNESLTKALRQIHLPTAEHEAGMRHLLTEVYNKSQRLLIRDRGQTHVIPLESIDYVEAQDDYIVVHSGEKSWMKTQSLSELEKQFNSEKFVRIHRSYFLHLPALTSVERTGKDTQVAVLRSGKKIPVSRTGMEKLKPWINSSTITQIPI